LTGAIAAENETRVRVIQGMERAERKRASAGWCNSVIFHLRTCAWAQKEIQTMEFSTVCKTNAGPQLLASNLVQD
jgi:hypothetical protein